MGEKKLASRFKELSDDPALRDSDLERTFDTWLSRLGSDLGEPEKNYRFLPNRKLELDRAWPEYRVAVELQGGTWIGGAHVRGGRYRTDCMKLALAQLAGWMLFWVPTDWLEEDPVSVINTVRAAFARRSVEQKGGKE